MYLNQLAPKPPRSRGRTVAILAVLGVAGLCSLVVVVSVIRAAVVTVHDTSKLAAQPQPYPVASVSHTPYPIESISLEPTTPYTPTPPPTTAVPTTMPPAPTTTTQPPGIYDEGTLLVPSEVKPGTYRATVPADSFGCYWARLKGTGGQLSDIIANGLGQAGTRITVTIKASDKAFEQHGCGEWQKVS